MSWIWGRLVWGAWSRYPGGGVEKRRVKFGGRTTNEPLLAGVFVTSCLQLGMDGRSDLSGGGVPWIVHTVLHCVGFHFTPFERVPWQKKRATRKLKKKWNRFGGGGTGACPSLTRRLSDGHVPAGQWSVRWVQRGEQVKTRFEDYQVSLKSLSVFEAKTNRSTY